MTVSIYRVACPECGVGPHQHNDGECAGAKDPCFWSNLVFEDNPGANPCPWEDVGRKPYKWERCGFMSIDELHRWFSLPARQLCQEKGFRLIVMEAYITAWTRPSHGVSGLRQYFYNHQYAEIKEVKDLV